LQDAGISLATVRAGNVIGGGDWAEDRLVPDMLKAFENGLPVVIRNPLTRPWQHVWPYPATWLWQKGSGASLYAFAEGWNFGPKTKTPNR
jgi:CDP-glucose 4,6-dehydratase